MPIHLHLHEELPTVSAEDLALLDAADRARAGHYAFERDRRQCLLSRVLLRRYVGECLGVRPEGLAWTRTAEGKPGIERVDAARCAFSLSHTPGAIAIFVGHGQVGIDIENMATRAFRAEVAATVFNGAERAVLDLLPAGRRSAGAFELWTRKEALLKADGSGLGVDPREVDLSGDPPMAAEDGGGWSCQFAGRLWFGRSRRVAQDWLCSIAADHPVDPEPWRA